MKEDKKLNHGPHGEGCNCPWPVNEIPMSDMKFEVLPGSSLGSLTNLLCDFIGKDNLRETILNQFPRTVELVIHFQLPPDFPLNKMQITMDNQFGIGFQKIQSAKDLTNGETCTEFE